MHWPSSRLMMALAILAAISAALAIGLTIYRLFALPPGVAATMCRDVNADNEPLGATMAFEADAETLHCAVQAARARRGARLKAVFIAVDALEAPNYVVDVVAATIEGAGYVDLALHRNETLWPAGNYRVELYLDEVWQRTLIFEILAIEATPSPEPPTITPSPLPTIRPTITPAPLGARVVGASLAHCDQSQPATPVPRFRADEAALCYTVQVVGAPVGTLLEVAWLLQKDDGAFALIRATRYEVEGNQKVLFRLARGDAPWPTGAYRVELTLNGELVHADEFTVEPAP